MAKPDTAKQNLGFSTESVFEKGIPIGVFA